MQKNNNVPESIWAAGVPENVNPDDVLNMDLLVSMAVDYLMKNIIIVTGEQDSCHTMLKIYNLNQS